MLENTSKSLMANDLLCFIKTALSDIRPTCDRPRLTDSGREDFHAATTGACSTFALFLGKIARVIRGQETAKAELRNWTDPSAKGKGLSHCHSPNDQKTAIDCGERTHLFG